MMRKAITTRYHGPANVRGAKISARAPDNRAAFLDYDHSVHHAGRHAAVAKAYAERMNWPGLYVGGYAQDEDRVFVCVDGFLSGHRLMDLPSDTLGTEGEDWFLAEPKRNDECHKR